MNTTSLGRAAEAAVSEHLAATGYRIIATNWRRPICEIDIVAQKDKVIYFVEVKYRTKSRQGSGLDYITPKKLKQMRFAAEIWVSENDWRGDYRLMAAEVMAGQLTPQVERLVEV